jgi:hypothetical protein
MRQHSQFRFVCAASLLWFAEPSGAQTAVPPEDETLLRASVEGYLANVESFPFLTCRYTKTAASTATLDDAIAGRNYQNVQVSDRRVVVDGGKVRVSHAPDPESAEILRARKLTPMPGFPGRGMVEVTFRPEEYLAKDGNELAYVTTSRSVNLFTPVRPYSATDDSPLAQVGFGRDKKNIATYVRKSDTGGWSRKIDGHRTVDGVTAFCVSFTEPTGRGRVEIALDPQRGYLPIRDSSFADTQAWHQVVTHVRACSKARWFPERIVWVWPREPSGRFSLRETKVVELDVDRRPRPEEFAIDLPAGAGVINNAES